MNKKKPLLLRIAALALAVSMLAGCESQLVDALVDTPPDILNKTISSDSKWINSNIDGSIDENTNVRLQDDFYTAINKDNFLATTLEDSDDVQGSMYNANTTLNERLHDLMKMERTDTTGLDTEIMSEDTLIHLQDVMHDFYDLVADTTARDNDGCEPVRKYIDNIQSISSMDELDAYFEDNSDANLYGITLLPVSVERGQTTETEDRYTVYVSASAPLSLGYSKMYNSLDLSLKEFNDDIVRYALDDLGYTSDEINSILKGCYGFEIKLAKYIPATDATPSLEVYDRDSLQELAGDYPILGIIDAYGYGASELYTVAEPDQVENVAKIYTDANLEDIKDYLIVHTITSSSTLLDSTIYEKTMAFQDLSSDDTEEDSEEDGDVWTYEEQLYYSYVFNYLTDAMQQIYIAHYCTADEKAQIVDMVHQIVDAYKQILSGQDWMSEETCAKAIEKLDNIGINVLYPNELTDYSGLDLSDCTSLLEAVHRINAFETTRNVNLINQPVDQNYWDFSISAFATTEVNALNLLQNNSIYILAGYIADTDTYDPDESIEYNFARLGSVIGHEISHSFDSSGYNFDKYGLEDDWWTAEDREAFEKKTAQLEKYYNALTPITGDSSTYKGSTVSGEVIADMGGMRAALTLAQQYDNFDYDEYFRNYAELWFVKYSYTTACSYFINDEHPLAFLRANVTLAQFDEFQQTYNIQPGDGMYISQENRIAVW